MLFQIEISASSNKNSSGKTLRLVKFSSRLIFYLQKEKSVPTLNCDKLTTKEEKPHYLVAESTQSIKKKSQNAHRRVQVRA